MSIKKKILTLVICILSILIVGCSKNENKLSKKECASLYSEATELMEQEKYKDAYSMFQDLADYEDSIKYYNYCYAMAGLQQNNGNKIYGSDHSHISYSTIYTHFKMADDVKDAPEYVSILEPIIENVPGYYESSNRNGNYIYVNESLDFDALGVLNLTINTHYHQITDIKTVHPTQPSNDEYIKTIQFADDYSSFYVEESGKTYIKITKEEYDKGLHTNAVLEERNEILKEIDSYPLLSTEDALNLLIGNTFNVDCVYVVEKYTFYDNYTYDIVNYENETKNYKWEADENAIYAHRNGERCLTYNIRKYNDHQYLLCQNHLKTENPKIFIMTNVNDTSENEKPELLKKEFFYECEDLITPDCIDSHFKLDSSKVKDGLVIHKYYIDAATEQEASDIIQKYYDYIMLDEQFRELYYKCEKNEDGVFIIKQFDKIMIAAMQGGTDPGDKYFLMCSLEEKKE